ncbi:MAG: adenosylcobinamide-phosphate synthase CbiB [Desulfovibrio sp.]
MLSEYFYIVNASIIVIAVALDWVLADPHHWPHPVRYIGHLLDWMEIKIRELFPSESFFICGISAVVFTVAFVAASVALLTSFSTTGFIGVFVSLYLAYSGLALRGLIQEAENVLVELNNDNISAARKNAGMIVSRDLSESDESEVRRAVAESVSENFNDGFVAPLFWLCLAGPVGLWGYKTVSTFDSMWGYKTERYKDLGCAGAVLDDILAWVPARLSALALAFAGVSKKNISRTEISTIWKKVSTQAGQMESPNAGYPMAMCAHLCKRRMGGPTLYFGEVKEKPVLGEEDTPLWNDEGLENLVELVKRAAVICTVAGVVASLMLGILL